MGEKEEEEEKEEEVEKEKKEEAEGAEGGGGEGGEGAGRAGEGRQSATISLTSFQKQVQDPESKYLPLRVTFTPWKQNPIKSRA